MSDIRKRKKFIPSTKPARDSLSIPKPEQSDIEPPKPVLVETPPLPKPPARRRSLRKPVSDKAPTEKALPKPASDKETDKTLPKHELRKREIHLATGIPIKDIFVDPVNGVELYRTVNGGWVTNPEYMGVEYSDEYESEDV